MLRRGVVTGVLDDAFTDAERKIEAAMRGIPLLEVLADPERMEVVVEAKTVALEALIESALAGVAEGRVADVVDQGKSLGEVFVQAEAAGNLAGNLHDLDGVRKARTEVVGGAAGKDLRLAGEAAKGARLNDTLAVALEGGSRRPWRRGIDARQKTIVRVVRVNDHGESS